MRILYIWDADYPWDVRVEKICMSLTAKGHEVHIAARNLKRRECYERLQDLHVHRIPTWENEKLNYAFSFPAFFSPFWKRFLDKIITQQNIDLIIVRDLPMAIAGIWAGRRHSLPIIFDMAEDYVAMIRDIWRKRKFHGLNLVVRNPHLAKLVAKYSFKRFDHIMVVVEEARDVAVRGGALPERVIIVGNTPELHKIESTNSKEFHKVIVPRNHYTAIYTGGIQLGRGLQVVFRAIEEIIPKVPNFLFVVVGDGYAVSQLKELAKKIGVELYVNWVGWVDHHDLFQYIRNADVGIIPHMRSAHVDTTVPNKIFDYMACGLPVIASDAPPMKRIVSDNDIGLVFKGGESSELANAIVEIYNSPKSYGENGRRAVQNRYNWSWDEKRLLSLIENYSSA